MLRLRSAFVLAASLVGVLSSGDVARAAPVRVHVRGAARIDAHASRSAGKLVLRGTLLDDTGAAIANDHVTVVLSLASAPGEPLDAFTQAGPSAPEACSFAEPGAAAPGADAPRGPSPAFSFDAAHRAVVPTDDGGHFCLRVGLPVDKYVAHLAWPGAGWIDASTLDVAVDLSLRSVALAFSPERHELALDAPTPLILETTATLTDDETVSAAPNLPLRVTNEAGTPLGSGVTNDSGRLRLYVDPSRLGPPGPGELRLLFDGSPGFAVSQYVARVERRTHVVTSVPEARGGTLDVATPEEGIAVSALVRTPSGDPVPSGSVEALVGSRLVGAGPVEAGAATMTMMFPASPATPKEEMRLRYVPEAPWFLPGPETSLELRLRTPSPFRKLPLLAAGLGVIAWLVLSRTARGRRPAAEPRPGPPASSGEASVQVVRSVRSARAGWTGRVVDAHEGEPVPEARVVIERGKAERRVIASTLASEGGRFELRADEAQQGDLFVVEAPAHARLQRPLPPFGEIEVALVSRRRALLDRLVAWARARGGAFDAKPEPTPGHVRRAAAASFATARWADAVERTAYGPEVVDARAEAEVERLAPRPDTATTLRDLEPPNHEPPSPMDGDNGGD